MILIFPRRKFVICSVCLFPIYCEILQQHAILIHFFWPILILMTVLRILMNNDWWEQYWNCTSQLWNSQYCWIVSVHFALLDLANKMFTVGVHSVQNTITLCRSSLKQIELIRNTVTVELYEKGLEQLPRYSNILQKCWPKRWRTGPGVYPVGRHSPNVEAQKQQMHLCSKSTALKMKIFRYRNSSIHTHYNVFHSSLAFCHFFFSINWPHIRSFKARWN